MGSDYRIEYFYEVRLTRRQLFELNKEDAAFLASLCFFHNEIYLLYKLLIANINHGIDETVASKINAVNRTISLRLISSKIIEAIKLWKDQRKIWARRQSLTLSSALASKIDDLESVSSEPMHKASVHIRNLIGNHLIVSEFEDALDHTSDNADLNLYIHRETGNSFYSLGEEVLFSGLLNKYIASELPQYTNNAEQFIDDWLDWNDRAHKALESAASTFITAMLLGEKINASARRTPHFLAPENVGDLSTFRFPSILSLRH